MFANTQMGGIHIAFPDVCKTPTPAGPVPIPYPNIATGMTAVPNVPNVFISGMPAHNLATTIPISNGDNAGVLGGVASQMVMGPARHQFGSTNVLVGGMPATKMLSPTGQNGMAQNIPGATLAPSQVQVMIVR